MWLSIQALDNVMQERHHIAIELVIFSLPADNQLIRYPLTHPVALDIKSFLEKIYNRIMVVLGNACCAIHDDCHCFYLSFVKINKTTAIETVAIMNPSVVSLVTETRLLFFITSLFQPACSPWHGCRQ